MIVLPPPSNELVEAVYSTVGVDKQRVEEAVKALREWLELQPHLPHVMDDKRLENIFLRCKASMEKTKNIIDMYYTLRTAVPEFFGKRDPAQQWFKTTTEGMYHMMLPKLTDEYYRVIIFGLLDKEAKFDINESTKVCLMCHEVTLEEDCSAGNVIILDVKDATIPLVAKFTPTMLQKAKLCILKGFKCRVKAFHFLNVPSYAIPVINLLISMLTPKLAKRMIVHQQPGYDLLLKYVSPKILPQEYGGEAESLVEMWDDWKKKLLSYREWFLEEENLKADESKRPGKALTSGDLFGIEGSFRQLAVD